MSIPLLIFLLVDVFIIGVLVALAARHIYAHMSLKKHTKAAPHPSASQVHLPPAIRERLIEDAAEHFEAVLEHSTAALQRDLEAGAASIKRLLEKEGTEYVARELKAYRERLIELQKQTEEEASGSRAELAKRKTELHAKLEEEIAAEKQRLIAQIDTRLADAVASFLTETLQHNIDLGAQTAYLTSVLDEHKADFTKGVSGETSAGS